MTVSLLCNRHCTMLEQVSGLSLWQLSLHSVKMSVNLCDGSYFARQIVRNWTKRKATDNCSAQNCPTFWELYASRHLHCKTAHTATAYRGNRFSSHRAPNTATQSYQKHVSYPWGGLHSYVKMTDIFGTETNWKIFSVNSMYTYSEPTGSQRRRTMLTPQTSHKILTLTLILEQLKTGLYPDVVSHKYLLSVQMFSLLRWIFTANLRSIYMSDTPPLVCRAVQRAKCKVYTVYYSTVALISEWNSANNSMKYTVWLQWYLKLNKIIFQRQTSSSLCLLAKHCAFLSIVQTNNYRCSNNTR